MAEKEITTTISYNANCHYNKSSQKQKIRIPLITPTLSVSIPKRNNKNQWYYNDILNITAQVNNQWGTVSFYFIDQNDISQAKQLINDIPIPINALGQASVEYLPHNSGSIYVEYHGAPYYNDVVAEESFILSSRPVHIQFNEYSPYLVDEKETTTINVSVTDELTEEPLDYGLVTFLNYRNYNEGDYNGNERVIGNPQYLINGQASIRYSPIQLDDDERDLLGNIELIRAAYNYNNEAYGLTWDYYASHDDWTSISICRNNQVNILVPTDGSDNPIKVNDEALFIAKQTDNIKLRCDIVLSDTNTKVEGAKVTFIAENINNDDVIFIPAFFNEDKKNYQAILSGNNILPYGTYKIYAQADNITDSYGQTIPVINSDTNVNLPTHPNNDSSIIDGIYLKSNISESFYIKIEPAKNDFTLDLVLIKEVITNRQITNADFVLNFRGSFTETEKAVFVDKKCYFEIDELQQTYEGVISLDEDGKIIGKMKREDALPVNIGNYTIRGYIKEGTYTYIANNQTITKTYPTQYSNNKQIEVRDELNITLQLNKSSTTYPGDIEYIIQCNNINNTDFIDTQVYIDQINEDHIISNHQLTKFKSTIKNKIPPQDAGEHTIFLFVDKYNIIQQKSIKIKKAEMNINLYSDNYISSSNADILLNIEHENKYPINTINLSNFAMQIKHNEKTQNIDSSQLYLKTIEHNENDIQYQLQIKWCNLYDAGDWELIINYTDDDDQGNYNNIDDTTFPFTVSNITPVVRKIQFNENNIIAQVNYIQQNDQIQNEDIIQNEIVYNNSGQNILILTTLSNGNGFLYFVNVTNSDGQYILERPEDILPSEWSTYTTLKYQIVPKNDILNAFKNAQDDIKQIFIKHFHDYQYHEDGENNIIFLYTQAQNNHFITLFTTYNEASDTITLLDGDEINDGFG